ALLALEPEEIAFLTGSKSVTKTIQKTYEEAQAMREAEVEHEVEVFGGFGKRSVKAEDEPGMPVKEKPETNVKKETKAQSSLFDF
ncbi:MAG: hypothetical protein Q8N79_09110, partial [Candidatus Methanoperedens sp.]|nr:hypothetical protein [Candidatus Methanoperedens sp.]